MDLTLNELTLIRNGQFIHAIKSVRERHGVGLREAKDFVDAARVALGLAVRERKPCSWCNGRGYTDAVVPVVGQRPDDTEAL